MLLLAALSVGLAISAEVTPPAAAPAVTPPAVTSTTAPPATFEQKQKAKLKCEKLTLIGSRMPTRVCRTPEQIDQSKADAKEMTREMQKINPEQYH